MERFNIRCPDRYPMKCNLSPADIEYLNTPEKYKGFFIFQYNNQDEWLLNTLEGFFAKRTWRLYNAGNEAGSGTKFCKVCRFALASDFGIVSLTPLNYNVYQEIGLMQGLQKPLLYLCNPERKKVLPGEKFPFDTDDKIYIEHTDKESLEKGLDKELGLLLEKVKLLTGFESERRERIRIKVAKLNPDAIELLKGFVLEGDFFIPEAELVRHTTINFGKKYEQFVSELVNSNFIVKELGTVGTRKLVYNKFNENYRKDLKEILWE
ncbi:hypothetical protein H8E88_01315 [candidate division KSB1 bacterium]|nr:hypothetical protein [candidate division KSB1 bacterium]